VARGMARDEREDREPVAQRESVSVAGARVSGVCALRDNSARARGQRLSTRVLRLAPLARGNG
jgi:hypothetical protein